MRSRTTSRSTTPSAAAARRIKYVDAPVPGNAWHTLRVEFSGTRIRVSLDGKAYIELDDSHIAGPGAVGVWTKADSVTAFDDFTYQSGAVARMPPGAVRFAAPRRSA